LLIGSESVPCNRPRCFDEARIGNEVVHINDVTGALDYLRDAEASVGCDNGAMPTLLFVWSTVGSEALATLLSRVRNDERLTHTRIVVLTSTGDALQADSVFGSSSTDYVIHAGDTDILLDVVSKHFFANGSLASAAQA
jgi:DNA-binding NarL/FixJ family response regulator